MKDIVKEKQLKEVLYGLDYIANKSKSGKLELGVNNCKLLLEEIERLNNIIKEVREYINQLDNLEDKIDDYAISKYVRQELLEILDKAGDEK